MFVFISDCLFFDTVFLLAYLLSSLPALLQNILHYVRLSCCLLGAWWDLVISRQYMIFVAGVVFVLFFISLLIFDYLISSLC